MMIFSSKAKQRRQRRASGAVAAALAAFVALGLLAPCGGGTSQYSSFTPARLLVFGDEDSVILPSGAKYTVNGLNANNLIDCSQQPIWVQSVAASYRLVFAECNPSFATPTALMRAEAGAQVADVQDQVVAQIAAGGFRVNDLATVLAGTNDILALYAQYPGRTVEDLSAEAGARGKQLALVVNQLVSLGVKVLISDLPDVGLTPYALAQKALDSNVDRAAVLSQLTTAFNEQLGVNVVLDGRYVGLVQTQLQFQAIGRSPTSFGFSNIVDPVCTVPLPNCTTATLVPGAVVTQYLWADTVHLAPGAQSQLASLAIARARGNPF